MKIKPHHRRDFSFYLQFARRNKVFDPEPRPVQLLSKGDANALQCFVQHESQKDKPKTCRQPRVFEEVQRGKRLVNFHIKQWARDWPEALGGTFGLEQVKDEFLAEGLYVPDWVWQAVCNQGRRGMRERWREMRGL